MTDVFLIGGGRGDDAVRASHAPFVAAVGDGPIVAVVLDEGDETDVERWSGALTLAGANEVRSLVVSKQRPPVAADFDGAAAVFVAGGWTPGYHEALVEPGTDWLPQLPFAGFSAGAAVAGEQAILGGHRIGDVAICAEEAGEDLEQLTVRPGLGLVPFAVDVHATQWGTLTRLVHAARAGAVSDGLAVDEGTVAVVRDGALVGVEGVGAAYRVNSALQLEIVRRW